MKPWTRRNEALLRDRDAGMTYRALSEKYGIGPERARQIVMRERQIEREEPTHCSLCGAPTGEPHVRFPGLPPVRRKVHPRDLGHGVWEPRHD